MKKQWEKRVDVFKFMYTCLIHEIDPSEFVVFSFDQGYEFEVNELKMLEYIAEHLNELIEEIKPLLSKTWKWERLSLTDQAILLVALAEANVLDTPKKVIIDQALITARKYGIDETYKYINPILDKLIKDHE